MLTDFYHQFTEAACILEPLARETAQEISIKTCANAGDFFGIEDSIVLHYADLASRYEVRKKVSDALTTKGIIFTPRPSHRPESGFDLKGVSVEDADGSHRELIGEALAYELLPRIIESATSFDETSIEKLRKEVREQAHVYGSLPPDTLKNLLDSIPLNGKSGEVCYERWSSKAYVTRLTKCMQRKTTTNGLFGFLQ